MQYYRNFEMLRKMYHQCYTFIVDANTAVDPVLVRIGICQKL